MIRVLIAEDSPVMQDLISHVLQSDPDISIVGVATNGKEAIELVKKFKPDVLTMDVNMPVMNGLEATRIIMQECPLPVIIVSSDFHPQDVGAAFKALEYGAVVVAEKPHSYGAPQFDQSASRLIRTVKLMSEIKVVRRNIPAISPIRNIESNPVAKTTKNKIRLIAIGASTGGPQALEKILSSIPADFDIPIIILQHITSGFTAGFADWVKTLCKIPVLIAAQNTKIARGKCYIAPEGFHTEVTGGMAILLRDEQPEHGSRPSVSVLFRSLSVSLRSGVAAVLLSGMGKDGSAELGLIRANGGITIAQDYDSSLIFGMPGEAVKLGSAQYVLSSQDIGIFLSELNK